MAADAIRTYADASVFGGRFDEEFEKPTTAFFEQVRAGRFALVSSAVVRRELEPAPDRARECFKGMEPFIEFVDVTDAARRLQAAYLRSRVVGEAAKVDALHVAVATVSGCRLIVSWNFGHIVHFKKIPLYGGVNLAEGYGQLGIHTPREVIDYEGQNEDV